MKEQDKRKLHPALKKALSIDVQLTNQFIKSLDKLLAFRQLRTHYHVLEISCHGLFWIPAWVAFIWVLDNANLYQMQVNFLLGLLLDVVIVALLKAVTRRRRPTSPNSYDLGPDKFSFPSGHASRASFIACYFVHVWSLHWIFVPPLLSWAVAVCVSRIMLKRHHLLDVVVGLLVGAAQACFVAWIFLEEKTCRDFIWWLTDERTEGGEYHV